MNFFQSFQFKNYCLSKIINISEHLCVHSPQELEDIVQKYQQFLQINIIYFG